DWDSKDAVLESGLIDCIWSGFTYEERENDYAWTVRYLDNTIVVLTNKAEITDLASLAGKIVGVQSDSSGETALKSKTDIVASLKNGKYSTDASYTTAFTKLTTGAYDAIVVDIGVANYLISSMSAEDAAAYSILEENISVETYGVGFRKADTELCKKVSDAMEEVAKDVDFIKSICEKYDVDYNVFTLGK
ncbi:MAG: transporter substrate-binding domain-containing protein, partial [Eubacteriales bacterium]